MNKIVLCYCVNRKMHIPLCVSLYTAATHLDPNYHLSVRVFGQTNITQLRKCLDKSGHSYDLHVKPLRLGRFRTLNSLHGDRMAWGRVLLPRSLSDEKMLIYLDADTIVLTDLAQLDRIPLHGHALGAVAGGKLRYALECRFFQEIGLDLEANHFNSGVLVFNVQQWQNENRTTQIAAFARRHRQSCKAADQTALNAVFHGNFCHLPSKFNKPAGPNTNLALDDGNNGILHFIGSPKPWDLGGSWLHNGHSLFIQYVDMLELRSSLFRQKFHFKNLYRTARTGRSYMNAVGRRLA